MVQFWAILSRTPCHRLKGVGGNGAFCPWWNGAELGQPCVFVCACVWECVFVSVSYRLFWRGVLLKAQHLRARVCVALVTRAHVFWDLREKSDWCFESEFSYVGAKQLSKACVLLVNWTVTILYRYLYIHKNKRQRVYFRLYAPADGYAPYVSRNHPKNVPFQTPPIAVLTLHQLVSFKTFTDVTESRQ